MVNLSIELRNVGYLEHPDHFRGVLRSIFNGHYPGWTDEELLYHPKEASNFCTTVRERSGAPGLADPVILRTLVNIRKRGGCRVDGSN